MIEQSDTLLYKIRFLLIGMLVLACLFVLSVLFAATSAEAQSAQSDSADSYAIANLSNDPNVVAGGMGLMFSEFMKFTDSLEYRLSYGVKSTTATVAGSGQTIADGSKSVVSGVGTVASGTLSAGSDLGAGVVRGIGSSIVFTGRTVGSGMAFVILAPARMIGSVSETPVVSAVISPHTDHEDIPIIDPNSPALQAAKAALPATPAQAAAVPSPAAASADSGPQWPIHGDITTYFGVSHSPYQDTHTGIDISDGNASGITPVKPFRPGTVVEVIWSSRGLGNHVIIDHGGGVTSVYAHLASIAVQQGQ